MLIELLLDDEIVSLTYLKYGTSSQNIHIFSLIASLCSTLRHLLPLSQPIQASSLLQTRIVYNLALLLKVNSEQSFEHRQAILISL